MNTSIDYENTFGRNSFKNPPAASPNSTPADWRQTSMDSLVLSQDALLGSKAPINYKKPFAPEAIDGEERVPDNKKLHTASSYVKVINNTNNPAEPIVNGAFRDVIVLITPDEVTRTSLIVSGYNVTYRIYQEYVNGAWQDVMNGTRIIAFELNREAVTA